MIEKNSTNHPGTPTAPGDSAAAPGAPAPATAAPAPLTLRRVSPDHPTGAFEFHVSRSSRDRYEFEDAVFSTTGNVVFADFAAARRFAQRINAKRDPSREGSARASDLNAMALLDEIMHQVVRGYRTQVGKSIFQEAEENLRSRLGNDAVEKTLRRFCELFPPRDVYRGTVTIDQYLDSEEEGLSGRERAFEELILLWIQNENPAYENYAELFDDEELETGSSYRRVIEGISSYMDDQPAVAGTRMSLIDFLMAPIRAHPYSVEEQLGYVRKGWSGLIGSFLFRLLQSLDMIREENKPGFAGGKGPAQVYDFTGAAEDVEAFSPDKDWMPKVVLLAKSTLVWLDQLSKQYQRDIHRLDQIPDEVLDTLAQQGFNALWLIGLWQRSPASKTIKRKCGNPEAEASAYSLLNYEIADELGGWDALANLRHRLWARGIRLASDMVPNHTGIDGDWVLDHPDWFVQVEHSPFPGYTFEGENLSRRDDVGIYLEDHYYNRSDAAVVFKRVDHNSGQVRYIYHGNDGTGLPWSDTAQLDFLKEEVREAVIQTILHVARNFPVIRFDAAMILAKRHFQRLWYPEPGGGGDIASRAEHAMWAEEFHRMFPEEFWRQVVDRVAEEAPDTLLLAEAFWMMEGYFVRTLGMHRVYNSAFMNMLKDEENAKYRQTIKNVLEFDKDILKRYVNFMNNPDEETAVAQFGTGDKYFGIATLMVTMPGLPMFGHGQIEGFAEKYGMEYRKAYWDEVPNQELIRRHEREIFPLMKRRELFADAQRFVLFDLFGDDGRVNENVYAYTNAYHDQRSMVFFNNSYEAAWGWIRGSTQFVEKGSNGQRHSKQVVLGEALGLHKDGEHFTIFREQRSGNHFIRRSHELFEDGLFVHLNGYESQVFMDIYEVAENEFGHYATLTDSLAGRGVPDIEHALQEVVMEPLHRTLDAVIQHPAMRDLVAAAVSGQGHPAESDVDLIDLRRAYQTFLYRAAEYCNCSVDGETLAAEFEGHLRRVFSLLDEAGGMLQAPTAGAAGDAGSPREAGGSGAPDATGPSADSRGAGGSSDAAGAGRASGAGGASGAHADTVRDPAGVATLFSLALSLPLGGFGVQEEPARQAKVQYLAGSWLLPARFQRTFEALLGSSFAERWQQRFNVLLGHLHWFRRSYEAGSAPRESLRELFFDSAVTSYLNVHSHEGVVWFNKELFDDITGWLYLQALYTTVLAEQDGSTRSTLQNALDEVYAEWRELETASGYRVDALIEEPTAETTTDETSSAGGTKSAGGDAGTSGGARKSAGGKKSGGAGGTSTGAGKGGKQSGAAGTGSGTGKDRGTPQK